MSCSCHFIFLPRGFFSVFLIGAGLAACQQRVIVVANLSADHLELSALKAAPFTMRSCSISSVYVAGYSAQKRRRVIQWLTVAILSRPPTSSISLSMSCWIHFTHDEAL